MTASLGLGTVQFGLDYGVSNTDGRICLDEVAGILQFARATSVRVLDTAAHYGESEIVLGSHDLRDFRIITKTATFDTPVLSAADADQLEATFEQSLKKLRCDQVEGLLIHHARNLLQPGGDLLWSRMQKLKNEGRVRAIGISVYEGFEIDALLGRYQPDIVQLPINVIDQRLIEGGQLEQLGRRGVEIHARSVFMQGLLLMDPDKTPSYFAPIRPLLYRWHEAVRHHNMTPTQAALAFVRNLPCIDVVIVGVNNLRQLKTCVDEFNQVKSFDGFGLECKDPAFLNPSMWVLG